MGLLKSFLGDMRNAAIRDQHLVAWIQNIPGDFGIEIRRLWFSRRFRSVGRNLRILPGAIIANPQNVTCHDNVSIGHFGFIQAGGGLCIGSDVMIGPYVRIWTQNHVFADPAKSIREQGYEFKEVSIGNDVWIGAASFIMPGAVIGDNCVISAGSIVGGKVYEEGSILAGNPARKIGLREMRTGGDPGAGG